MCIVRQAYVIKYVSGSSVSIGVGALRKEINNNQDLSQLEIFNSFFIPVPCACDRVALRENK